MAREVLDRILNQIKEAKSQTQPTTALEYVRAVYRGEIEADPWRMRAAVAALPFESPKLAMTAYLSNADDFAARLDKAIEKSHQPKVIEHQPEHNDE
jgi:hypothetical protein